MRRRPALLLVAGSVSVIAILLILAAASPMVRPRELSAYLTQSVPVIFPKCPSDLGPNQSFNLSSINFQLQIRDGCGPGGANLNAYITEANGTKSNLTVFSTSSDQFRRLYTTDGVAGLYWGSGINATIFALRFAPH